MQVRGLTESMTDEQLAEALEKITRENAEREVSLSPMLSHMTELDQWHMPSHLHKLIDLECLPNTYSTLTTLCPLCLPFRLQAKLKELRALSENGAGQTSQIKNSLATLRVRDEETLHRHPTYIALV